MAALNFGEVQNTICEIHPAVPMSIANHWQRVHETMPIGLLFGQTSVGLVQLKVACPLLAQINKNDQLRIKSHTRERYIPYLQGAYPNYNIIGLYYKDQDTIRDMSAVFLFWDQIQQNFEVSDQKVFLRVSYDENGIQMQANCVKLHCKELAILHPLESHLKKEPFRILQKRQGLDQLIERAEDYLQRVARSEIQPKEETLRRLHHILTQKYSAGTVEKLDLQMVRALFMLAKTQTSMFDKVSSSLQIGCA